MLGGKSDNTPPPRTLVVVVSEVFLLYAKRESANPRKHLLRYVHLKWVCEVSVWFSLSCRVIAGVESNGHLRSVCDDSLRSKRRLITTVSSSKLTVELVVVCTLLGVGATSWADSGYHPSGVGKMSSSQYEAELKRAGVRWPRVSYAAGCADYHTWFPCGWRGRRRISYVIRGVNQGKKFLHSIYAIGSCIEHFLPLKRHTYLISRLHLTRIYPHSILIN